MVSRPIFRKKNHTIKQIIYIIQNEPGRKQAKGQEMTGWMSNESAPKVSPMQDQNRDSEWKLIK